MLRLGLWTGGHGGRSRGGDSRSQRSAPIDIYAALLSQQRYLATLPRAPESAVDAARAYNEYRLEFESRFSRRFFNEHNAAEWFKERYDAEQLETRRQVALAVPALEARAQTLLDAIRTKQAPALHYDLDTPPELRELIFAEPDAWRSHGTPLCARRATARQAEATSCVVVAVRLPAAVPRRAVVEPLAALPGFVSLRFTPVVVDAATATRSAVVTFASPEQAHAAVTACQHHKITVPATESGAGVVATLELNVSMLHHKVSIAPPVTLEPRRVDRDLDLALALVKVDTMPLSVCPLFCASVEGVSAPNFCFPFAQSAKRLSVVQKTPFAVQNMLIEI